MGCAKSTLSDQGQRRRKTMRVRKPGPWRQQEPAMTRDELNAMRNEFWDTVPIYGGRQEIWDALRRATESELHIAQSIIDSHGIVLHCPDMTVCLDNKGTRYELPLYVLSEPVNLIQE
ncbi:ubiquitin domain-containing protein 1-like protein [Tanacetum coccineum]